MRDFCQNVKIDVPGFDLLVIVTKSSKQLKKYLNIFIKNKENREIILKEAEDVLETDCQGSYIQADRDSLMLFTTWQNDWKHWDTLVHEVEHLVDEQAKYRYFNEESEFKAYLAEGLFRKLRIMFEQYS